MSLSCNSFSEEHLQQDDIYKYRAATQASAGLYGRSDSVSFPVNYLDSLYIYFLVYSVLQSISDNGLVVKHIWKYIFSLDRLTATFFFQIYKVVLSPGFTG